MESNLKYLPINTSVRPAKIVILVDVNSQFWETDCLAIIAMFNKIWGGNYNLIVPTDGKTIAPSFLEIMKEYDPDYIYYYVSTVHQLKLFDFEKYKELLEVEKGNYPHLTKEYLGNQSDFLRTQLTDFKISDQLNNLLKRNLNSFDDNRPIRSFPYSEKTSYPLTDMTAILKYSSLETVSSIKIKDSTLLTNLMIYSNFGLVDPYLEESIRKTEVNLRVEEIESEQTLGRFLDLIYDRDNPKDRKSYGFKVPSVNLEYYTSYVDWEESNPIIIVGNEVSDFCLYYCLSRVKNKVYWLPENPNLKDEIYRIINSKRQSLIYEDCKAIEFISTSLKESKILEIIAAIEERYIHSEMIPAIVSKNIEHLVNQFLFILNKDNHINEQVLIFDGKTNLSIFPIDTPVPLYFSKVLPDKHYWITDIYAKDTLFPRNQKLSNELLIASNYNSRHIRITNQGLSYFSPNFVYFNTMGENIKSVKVNPYFKSPDPFNLFEKLFEKAGYYIKKSDKGNFEEVFIDKFNDLASLSTILLTDSYRELFNKFINTSSNEAGIYTNGILINKRRYLDYDTVLSMMNDTEKVSEIISNLTEKGVIERGFIFKCRSCRNTDWYSIATVDNTFKCIRCYEVQDYSKESLQLQPVTQRIEPKWYYKLNEMIYQAYYHNSLVPILSLNRLKSKSKKSFNYIPEVEIRKDKSSLKPIMEIDICCVVDGNIVIGECKKGNNLKGGRSEEEVIKKYLSLAEEIQAHTVVFSTMENWSQTTRDLLEEYQKITRNVKIEILENLIEIK
ncbi:hypothetical protein [Peribacillus sp. SCS-37]|uniref:hypothetical protein n=1 Tax=Paraperibacillus esterisolvens TaxID=3115296 RepID=UPI00390598A1